ncbi:hypothetical protein FB567DRAFT_531206 [Paraphoma chrysanthemicola]|uniref:Uncharacterized protein n=1 Tax=Paraphoma chrysanthemicola TaxID=798071 RepID=A0A8K0R1J0_9PLEO|nr:hypothetical protein FB567DRAFT_531206 [Paraphoma chrysanthemicola]
MFSLILTVGSSWFTTSYLRDCSPSTPLNCEINNKSEAITDDVRALGVPQKREEACYALSAAQKSHLRTSYAQPSMS